MRSAVQRNSKRVSKARTTIPVGALAVTVALITVIATSVFSASSAAAAPPSSGNLALNRPAVASSVESSSYPASNAVDNKNNTRWSSQFSDPQWIYVDLGQSYAINRVKLVWQTAYATAYQLQVSGDATNWTTIYSTSSGAGGTNDLSVSGSGRYVRMYGTKRATPYGYSLFDFEVFGTAISTSINPPTATPTSTSTAVSTSTPAATATSTVAPTATSTPAPTATATPAPAPAPASSANLAVGSAATASSLESSSYPASNAVDGNTSTRWSSQFSDPQWIYVDLGSSYAINQVTLMWEAAYARAYQIQVSSDAANWTTIYSTTTGAGGTENLTGLSGTGRYVRMYGTQRATPYGYSLFEFQVYSGSSSTVATATPAPTPAPTVTGTSPTPLGVSGSWNLAFDDEFNSSTLDSTKWTTCYPWANPSTGCTNTGNNELEWYMPSGVSVANGLLNLTVTNQSSGGKPYTSGMVSSAPNRFSYQYGFIEARVKLPAGKGMWPAFWTLPSDQSWPPEVDVMEMWSDPTAIYMNDHWSSGGTNYQDMTSFSGVDFSANFHTLGMQWSPTQITWYVDGNVVKTFTNTAGIPAKPMYILLNLAIDGNNPPDSTVTFPKTYQIDYVRAWQQ